MAEVEFFGATRQVTGSQHLIEFQEGVRVLVDCGLDLQRPGEYFPFVDQPDSIDVVILTHAHIDHSGLLPYFSSSGFNGPIYATHGTYELAEILLYDMAKLLSRKYGRNGRQKPTYFFNKRMVKDVLQQFVTVDYGQTVHISEDINFEFKNAGHLLGAAMVSLKFSENDTTSSLLFTGDLGRFKDILLQSPQTFEHHDYIITESTYGGRWHSIARDPVDVIAAIIDETCIKIPGRLIVPAFSVGRTQSFLYVLNQLRKEGILPDITVFTDSPLARKSTEIHEAFFEEYNEDAGSFRKKYHSLFDFENIIYLEDINSAEEIRSYQKPCIILTSSGMLQGGKSMDHMNLNLANPYCTILFIGYCAKGTFGRQLIDGLKSYRTPLGELPVMAKILSTDTFSGHADQHDLEKFFSPSTISEVKKIFLVHGEPDSMVYLQEYFQQLNIETIIPQRSQRFTIGQGM